MRSLVLAGCLLLCWAALHPVESKPGVVKDMLEKGKNTVKGIVANVCTEKTSEVLCGNRYFYYCDIRKGSLASRCRYRGLFYGLVIGIPALVIVIILGVVGAVLYMNRELPAISEIPSNYSLDEIPSNSRKSNSGT